MDTERIIEALEAWAGLVSSGYNVPAAGQVLLEAAQRLRELDEQIKRMIDDGK